ncbi:Resolvase domain-containing protein [Nitrosomonas sp. Is79A3]|uniref:recombinase family protein n=1 Tax=Nitrosomonas sp. (strain Is79A3) TaxID=261292 RepID=UPI000215D1BA
MELVGYARVSSTGQSLDVQVDKLNKSQCDKIYQEKRSGVTANRPELKNCLDYVREGDVLIITKLDRLARSTVDLHNILKQLNHKGVGFRVIDQSIDTTSPTGKLLFGILASIAEFETELRKERQMEGIKKAKENGIAFGRKSKLKDKQVEEMQQKRSEGILIKDLMATYKLSKASVYRLLTTEAQT